jgi:hypothetical protein
MEATETDTTPRYLREIIADGACPEAVEWCRAHATPESAWAACERADWMLWIASRRAGPAHSESRVRIVRVACEIARLVLPIFEVKRPDDDRPRKAIEAAESYCEAPSAERVEALRLTAAAADAADAAADAAYAAANAAAAAAAYAAYAKCKADILAIVRKHFPTMPERAS